MLPLQRGRAAAPGHGNTHSPRLADSPPLLNAPHKGTGLAGMLKDALLRPAHVYAMLANPSADPPSSHDHWQPYKMTGWRHSASHEIILDRG